MKSQTLFFGKNNYLKIGTSLFDYLIRRHFYKMLELSSDLSDQKVRVIYGDLAHHYSPNGRSSVILYCKTLIKLLLDMGHAVAEILK